MTGIKNNKVVGYSEKMIVVNKDNGKVYQAVIEMHYAWKKQPVEILIDNFKTAEEATAAFKGFRLGYSRMI